ncbi:MAG: DUF72 domain-containing protein [Candidatus Omnitrophota bacterium]
MSKGRCFIGTSGWYYPHWVGPFYPEGITKDDLLPFYARSFNTVELNNTFYHLPKETSVVEWYRRTPADFVFAVKASRFITHIKRLANFRDSLELFLNRAALLKEKLGVVLYQLPPALKKDKERLAGFLRQLPPRGKNVIEFRHQSWLDEEIFVLLEEFHTAYCIVSMPEFHPAVRATADFVYMRMHGRETLYGSRYSPDELKKCAGWIQGFLREGRDVYVYFNNDAQGYAVENARVLKEMMV